MKSKRKAAEPVLNRNGLTFEQAIQRLEKIVADMEAAELPLEDVLKKYEEGTYLVRFCNLKLEEAEKKIELLTRKADGSVSLKPFQAENVSEEAETNASNDRKRNARATAEDETSEEKEGKLF
jgi:exodeoxyribonuclease VII small subunit